MNLPLIFSALTVGLSCLAVIWLWVRRCATRKEWALHDALSGSVLLLAFLAGTWAFTSYYLRYLFLVLFVLAAVLSYIRVPRAPVISERRSRASVLAVFSLLFVFVLLDLLTVKAHYHPEPAMDLSFPLKSGQYYVLQGGNSPVTNPFHRSSPQERYALDLVKLNTFGNRARGLAPARLDAYESFGETVYSPCRGQVMTAVDGLPDNPPGVPDSAHPAGNHVIIACHGAGVLLAHLMRGSMKVGSGEIVATGQVIGRSGNSGNSSEPHLHISAARTATSMGDARAEAVPLTFNGSFLVLNSVVVVP